MPCLARPSSLAPLSSLAWPPIPLLWLAIALWRAIALRGAIVLRRWAITGGRAISLWLAIPSICHSLGSISTAIACRLLAVAAMHGLLAVGCGLGLAIATGLGLAIAPPAPPVCR
mgnify:CR=1 FL=1